MNTTRLKKKLAAGRRLRVLFLNDLGFQYGAGMAQLRQMESFALMGHEVLGICWTKGIEADFPLPEYIDAGLWLGLHELNGVHVNHGLEKREIITAVVAAVAEAKPDLVVVGNLHGAGWPVEVLLELKKIDALTVAYMHDFYLLTGRCAYPGDCKLYETGCTASCPTHSQYPWLSPGRIPEAWALRRQCFCGPEGIPLATNSRWLLAAARRALTEIKSASTVYLGVDERLFSPFYRPLARKLLGVPDGVFVVLTGAVNVGDRRKGWHIFQKVRKLLNKEAYFLVFGEASLTKKNVHAVGLLRDYRKMPLVYNAADVFVTTAVEEAFGQTVLEASACGIPAVAFAAAGGMPEAARDGVNAFLAKETTPPALAKAIDWLRDSPERRRALGEGGRAMIEAEFTLKNQGRRWMDYLQTL